MDGIEGEASFLPSELRSMRQELEREIESALLARVWSRQVSLPTGLANSPTSDGISLGDSLERARATWNAMTLVMVFGAIEGHIEALTKNLHPIIQKTNQEKRAQIARRNRLANAQIRSQGRGSPDAFRTLESISRVVLDMNLRSARRGIPPGPAADRWEDALERIYLRPRHDRPLPEDLHDSLNEWGAVRNVLLHGLGRLDSAALSLVVEGPWRREGELVVIGDELYRRYIAALMAFSLELLDRVRALFGLTPTCDTTRWRDMVPAGG